MPTTGVKVIAGLAARNPQQYCKAVKQKIKTNPLAMETWKRSIWWRTNWCWINLKCSIPPKMQSAMGGYKMTPTDFIEHMMGTYKKFMPSSVTVYDHSPLQDEIGAIGSGASNGRRMP